MKILALEFSSPQRSVAAVSAEGRETAAREVIESGNAGAMQMVEAALREAGWEREQVDVLAVGIGPGSYNGIRAAIAAAQGWELARGTKLLGISSADVIAEQAAADGLTGRAHVVIDAQREEFYLAGYELRPGSIAILEPLRLVSVDEIRRLASAHETLVGPEITQWVAEGRVVFPRASALGRLGLNRTDFSAGETLEPIYLRETNFVKAPPPRFVG